MALQAVTTTGIYCRAECVAAPAPANITPMRSKAEAEASGFRACLRCRPDRSPEPIAGVDHQYSGPVGHALILISEGFLDSASEGDLAARVGYSSRQLRRAFAEAVGATPTAVARSQRTHFARRLLDETDLRVTDIAFVAGFTSVRQMNRDVRKVFAFAPSELRARRRRGDMNAVDGGFALRVPVRGPHDLDAMFAFLAPRAIPGVAEVATTADGPIYRRTIAVCGHYGMIEVQPAEEAPGSEIQNLLVTVHLPTFASILDDVARVRSLFATDANPECAEAHLAHDPLIGPLIKARPGLRMPGCWDRFETAVRVVIGQHISVGAASTISGRLAQRFGTEADIPERPELSFVFPTAAQLAQHPPAAIAELGLPGARAEAIHALASTVAAEELDLTDPSTLRAGLLEIPGVGPWTADVIAMRVSQDSDTFAPGDLGLRHAVAELDPARTQPPSTAELEELSQHWAPYRTTAAIHLWQRHATDQP